MPRPAKSAKLKFLMAEFQKRNEKFSQELTPLQKEFDDAYAQLRRMIDAKKLEAVKASLKKPKTK